MLVEFEETESPADRIPVILDANGRVAFSFEPAGPLVVSPGAAWYVNGDAVWSGPPASDLLLSLPRSTSSWQFGADGDRLVVADEANGTAHLVDMPWLASLLAAKPTSLTDPQLIDLVCHGPAADFRRSGRAAVGHGRRAPLGLPVIHSGHRARRCW